MGCLRFLNQLVDDSDPDTDLDRLQHHVADLEAIRRVATDWMVADRPDAIWAGTLPVWRTQVGRRGRYFSGWLHLLR